MGIPGENLNGVLSCNEYLTRVNLMHAASQESDTPVLHAKNVAVIGGGNTAMEEALYLSNICNKVYIINRSNNLRSDKILIDQVNQKENVEILLESVAKTLIIENDVIKGLKLQNDKKISASGIFIAIGSDPTIDFIKDLHLQLDNNYILVKENMETTIEGIYACGDVIKKDLYQIVTAAGDGAIAANSVKNYLNR
jgi:thioredoxin reductase (NADPH)